MAYINWEHPGLSKLNPTKLNLLKMVAEELSDMGTDATISYILALNAKLKEQNITFSAEEYNLILGAVSGGFPDILNKFHKHNN